MKKLYILLIVLFTINNVMNAQIITDSLLLYYPFNGNALDASGHGFDGTVYGATLTSDRFGNPNSAYSFNGTNSYIEIPNNIKLKPNFPFTISFWTLIYNGGFPVFLTTDFLDHYYTGCIFTFSADSTMDVQFGNGGIAGSLSSRNSKMGSTKIHSNIWYHIIGVFRGPSDMDIYINCKNDGGTYEGTASTIVYSYNSGDIGRETTSSYDPPTYLNGKIDELRFWNRALTQKDIDNYNLCNPGSTADFTAPDTVCVGEFVNITNLSLGGSTYYWNFCSGNAYDDPIAVNIGNPGGLLSIPTYITLVKQGNDCFSFISCQGVGVIRYYHGGSFMNSPISWTNLGTFGLIQFNEEGIQIKNDNGNWYGFVNSYSTIIRMDFGNSLWNTPTAVDIGPLPSMVFGHGLVIIQEGTTWLGFVVCQTSNNLIKLNFGTSLSNVPVFNNFGDLGVLTSPYSLCLTQENSQWYGLVTMGGNSLARITFGTSLLNTPTAENLGNPEGFNFGVGLTLIRDCESTTGYWVNYQQNGQLGKLLFPNGITGNVIGQVLGNIGGLAYPHSFSELFRQNDTLYAYITNRGNGTLTRLTFSPCDNASVPSSILFNPPPFSYNSPGTYNIHLIVDEGLPDQVAVCKNIIVRPVPTVNLGPDRTICSGTSTVLDAGGGFGSYLWSTGVTTRTLNIAVPGSYWVRVKSNNCEARDTVNVSFSQFIHINLGPDTTLCEGNSILLNATVPDAHYLWQDGNSDSLYLVQAPGDYWVSVTRDGCTGQDTIKITPCQNPIWFPNAFTPNGDGKNDTFHGIGKGVDLFRLTIYNRWGEEVFETNNFDSSWDGKFRGSKCSTGVYFYIATYTLHDSSNKHYTAKGSVTLLR